MLSATGFKALGVADNVITPKLLPCKMKAVKEHFVNWKNCRAASANKCISGPDKIIDWSPKSSTTQNDHQGMKRHISWCFKGSQYMEIVSHDTLTWENDGFAPPAPFQPGFRRQIHLWKIISV